MTPPRAAGGPLSPGRRRTAPRGAGTARVALDRVLALYDRGLEGCARHDTLLVRQTLDGLTATLAAEKGEIAEWFRRLYGDCLRKSLAREVDHAASILAELRELWIEAASDMPSIQDGGRAGNGLRGRGRRS
jgi:hypothetical protein